MKLDHSFVFRIDRILRQFQVREKASSKEQGGVPLTLALVYEAGTEVHSQEILQVQSDTQLITNEQGRATLKVRLLVYCAVSIAPLSVPLHFRIVVSGYIYLFLSHSC